MFLKLFLTTNPKNRFSSFLIKSLPGQCKILIFTRSVISTAAFENPKKNTSVEYYKNYMLSKPESYPLFHNIALIKSEAKSNDESFKSLTDFITNLDNMSSDQMHKIIETEFSTCDMNEIYKKFIFINKIITRKSESANLLKLSSYITELLLKKSFSEDEHLKNLLIFRGLRNLKFKWFLKRTTIKLFRKIKYLSSQQLVLLFFGLPRLDFSKLEDKFFILSHINNNISKFNVDEIGVITYGLKKIKCTFNHHNHARAIFSKIVENIINIHPIPLGNMCKVLLNKRYLDSSCVLDFQEKALPYVSNKDISVLLSLLELKINNSYINSVLWENIIRKWKENISDMSLNDINRLVQQMVLHNIENEELLSLAVTKFDGYKDYSLIYQELIYFLSNLTHYKLYPQNLLDVVLSEQFISEKILTSKCLMQVRFHWWVLYCNLEIEKPECLNYSLHIKQRSKIHNSVYKYINELNLGYRKMYILLSIRRIEKNLKNLYGENAVLKTVCLPHYEVGFVLRFNKYFKAEPIPNNFNLTHWSCVKKPLDDDNYWIFLNVLNKTEYLDDETISRTLQTQKRLLKALKYIPVTVSNELYRKHLEENTEVIFISELIQKSLEAENLKIKAVS